MSDLISTQHHSCVSIEDTPISGVLIGKWDLYYHLPHNKNLDLSS